MTKLIRNVIKLQAEHSFTKNKESSSVRFLLQEKSLIRGNIGFNHDI